MIDVPLLGPLAPHGRGQVFHKPAFVGGIELVLGLVAIEPGADKEIVEAGGVNRFAAYAQSFELPQLGGDEREEVRSLGQFGEIVYAGDEVERRAGVLRVSQERDEVAADLVLGEGEQAQGRKRPGVEPLAVLADQHGILAHDVAEVVRAARNDHPAAARAGGLGRLRLSAGSVGQHGPQRADEGPRLVGRQVDDFLVEAVEDDERPFLPDKAKDVLGGDRALAELPAAANDLIEQLVDSRDVVLAVADVVAQIDENRQREGLLRGRRVLEPIEEIAGELFEGGRLADAVLAEESEEWRRVGIGGPGFEFFEGVAGLVARGGLVGERHPRAILDPPVILD